MGSPPLAPPNQGAGPYHQETGSPSAVDDINLGLEKMHFQQRVGVGARGDKERRYSPGERGGHHDGAMEFMGAGGNTASVYSVEGVGVGGGWTRTTTTVDPERRDSGHSFPPTPEEGYSAYDEQQQQQQQHQQQHYQQGYSSPYLPSDQSPMPPQIQQQQPQPQPYASSSAVDPRDYPHHPQSLSHLHHQPSTSSVSSYPQPPTFQPQPPHGGWGYDYSAAAAQNPYYAAATGQLGFPEGYAATGASSNGLHRVASSASSLGSLGGNGLARSMTTLNGAGGGGGPGPNRQKSSASNSNKGPPITKASVDEYRSRIKADPDPEAQFNFAKYLIEAAKKISSSASGDEKSAKKYRDALLAESLKLIKRLATQATVGKPAYADAQFFLANCLGNGSLGLQVDHEKAYNLYVQASKQNHSSATYRTAVCNEVGAGTRRDHARAVLFYRKASALGDTAGMYKLGMILLNGLLGQQRNLKDAVAWLKRAAAQADEDNPHALHELGLLYENSPPLPPSNNSSSSSSSSPSNPPSQHHQNHVNALATLVPFDPSQARELFTQAAQLGYPPSQFKLGTCYEYGSLTCPVDPRRSIAWYTRAAERGDAESELALSGWYLTGSEGVLGQSDTEAYLWARRAANKGLPKAEYAVGYYSEVGIGVKQDGEEAKRWYLRAAGEFLAGFGLLFLRQGRRSLDRF